MSSHTNPPGLFAQMSLRMVARPMQLMVLALLLLTLTLSGALHQNWPRLWLELEFHAWLPADCSPQPGKGETGDKSAQAAAAAERPAACTCTDLTDDSPARLKVRCKMLQAEVVDQTRQGLRLDYALAAAYTGTLLLLGLYLGARAGLRADRFRDQARTQPSQWPQQWRWRRLSVLAFLAVPLALLAGICDVVENLALLQVLELTDKAGIPEPGATPWLQLAAWSATLKFALLLVIAVMLLPALPALWHPRQATMQPAAPHRMRALPGRKAATGVLAGFLLVLAALSIKAALLVCGCAIATLIAIAAALLCALLWWWAACLPPPPEPPSTLSQQQLKAAELDSMGVQPQAPLFGIALSGGGIRSATFALGILQSLAQWGLLRRAHYLSTVSGGGYIGGFLHAWVRRSTANHPPTTPDSGLEQVQAHLAARPGDTEAFATHERQQVARHAAAGEVIAEAPGGQGRDNRAHHAHAQISWLRRYSRYLMPRAGLGGGDAAGLIGSMLRSVSLNLIYLCSVLTLFMLSLLMLLKLIFITASLQPLSLALALGMAVLALALFSANQGMVRLFALQSGTGRPAVLGARTSAAVVHIILTLLTFTLLLGGQAWLALAVAGDCGSNSHWRVPTIYGADGAHLNVCAPSSWVQYPGSTLLGGLVLTYVLGACAGVMAIGRIDPKRSSGTTLRWTLAGAFLGGLAGIAVLAIGVLALQGTQLSWPARWLLGAMLAPLLVASAIMLAGGINVAFSGNRGQSDLHLEYWARIGGQGLQLGVLFSVLLLVLLMGPRLIGLAGNLNWAAIITWLLGSGVGVLLAASRRTGDANEVSWTNRLLPLAPPLFVLGLLAAISYLLQRHLPTDAPILFGAIEFPTYAESLLLWLQQARWSVLLGCAGVLLLISALFACGLDVNLQSPSQLYRYRLVRAYLGASNDHRNPEPSTNFDPNDDLPLAALRGQRPYPLINTAINISASNTQLDWQDRRGSSFLLSPLYCGHIPVPTEPADSQPLGETTIATANQPGLSRQISLGAAMSCSGAAVDSYMGYHSNPWVSFLLSLFNLRLGAWLPNRQQRQWDGHAPGWLLLREMFGKLRADSSWLRLSDGGHFDNLGLYELLRRRPQLVICSDAGADPKRAFEDLGNAIRKCRIDFNIEIKIDVSAIKPHPAQAPDDLGRSAAGHAIGRIIYPDGTKGWLLYFKPALVQNLPPDIENYARANPEFPNHNTIDQFFNEADFESYRKLGRKLADELKEPLRKALNESVQTDIEARMKAMDINAWISALEKLHDPRQPE